MSTPTIPRHPVLNVPTYRVVVAINFAVIVFDGYDLIVYGSTVPALLQKQSWHLTSVDAGHIGSIALIGMFVGALLSGSLTDRYGRRPVLLASLGLYSLAMVLAAAAPDPVTFVLARGIGGIGFGAVVPAAVAITVEWAPESRRNFCSAVMTAGFAVGGIAAAGVAMWLLPVAGFRILYLIGALPIVTLVPLVWWLVPESPAYLNRRDALADRVRPTPITALLRGRTGVATALFCAANFCVGVIVFGLNTWLPHLMATAGFPIRSALLFQLLLNVGAIIGAIAGSIIADRTGARPVVTWMFLIAAVCISLLGVAMPAAALYSIVLFAGVGATGTQIVMFGYVATHFAAHLRARSLGATTSFARLGGVAGPTLGAYLITSSLGLFWSFGTFAMFALIGAVAAVFVPTLIRAPKSADGALPVRIS
ncbi:MFS transporter (plasmid) [Mycolicibacterium psychrotolerans]|uniref:MFS transporter n=1 Tax=Mycolicibacterium psychrotolerans TaxID=216929 RepID=UPI003D674DA7